jgi:hypothetical protein
VRGDGPALEDLADDLAVLDGFHPEADEAVVYEEPVARPDVVGESLVGGREPARVAHEVPRGDDEAVALHQPRPTLDLAGPDLGALQVLHHRHVTPQLLRRRPDDLGVPQVHVVVAVAEVEPRYVYPDPDEGPYALLGGGRGSQGGDYLRPTHAQTPFPGLTRGLNAIRPG